MNDIEVERMLMNFFREGDIRVLFFGDIGGAVEVHYIVEDGKIQNYRIPELRLTNFDDNDVNHIIVGIMRREEVVV